MERDGVLRLGLEYLPLILAGIICIADFVQSQPPAPAVHSALMQPRPAVPDPALRVH
jgi:hypothetical protein